MRAALASRNRGKLRELRALLSGWQVDPLDVTDIGEETGTTFYDNARAKAHFARSRSPAAVWGLGEDSGLEVDALGGAPGIASARFAGPSASDAQNVEKLLAALRGVDETARRARFVCELVLISESGREVRGSGAVSGTIAREARGTAGFG